jgi:predicted RNA-binding protein with PIN domain
MNIEERLIQDKAERLSAEQLLEEMERCQRGVRVAATPAARKRFEARHNIMSREWAKRLGGKGVA